MKQLILLGLCSLILLVGCTKDNSKDFSIIYNNSCDENKHYNNSEILLVMNSTHFTMYTVQEYNVSAFRQSGGFNSLKLPEVNLNHNPVFPCDFEKTVCPTFLNNSGQCYKLRS